MNITELFIRRPVMTTLLTAALLIFGYAGYMLLPVSDMPNVDFPTIQIRATLPGSSPETMAANVATPLEKQLSAIAGIDIMSSTSTLGLTEITLQFNLSRNIDMASQDVQAAIARAQGNLPTNMPSPPTYQKVNPGDQPIIYIAVTSQTMPLSQVNEYITTFLTQRISMISGVSQVLVYGEKRHAVRIKVNPDLLAAKGIGIDEVSSAISAANVNLPTGVLKAKFKNTTINAYGQLFRAAEYRPIIVAYKNGNPVRLNEIAEVYNDVSNEDTDGRFNGEKSLVVAIKRQPGSNTIEVVDNIQRILPTIRQNLPAGINMEVMYDRSQSIRESVEEVKFTLLASIGLVVLVVFLFLRNVTATVITSLALPTSLVATFGIMYALGYTIDNISLMAMTLSVGFVVDDAVVMLENVFRHMEMGKRPLQAALDGAKEVGFTIISMTLSLAVVFLPVMFMSGLIGRILNEFAVTISVAILISGVVSLSLTPMLCSRFLKPGKIHHEADLHQRAGLMGAILRGYETSLRFAIRHRFSTLLFAIGLLFATAHVFKIMPKGFIPSDDQGYLFGFALSEQGISYSSMAERQHSLTPLIMSNPSVARMVSVAGIGQSNNGFMFVKLKPRDERPNKINADGVMAQLRGPVMAAPGLLVFLQNPPLINLSPRLAKASYQYTLQSADTQELYSKAQEFELKLRELPDLQDISSDLQLKNPQVDLAIDRDQAMTLGVSAQRLENALSLGYSQNKISTINAPTDQYDVIVEVESKFKSEAVDLTKLFVKSDRGKLVPLESVAKLTPAFGPVSVNHTGQLPSVTIFFNLKPGVALGDATKSVEELARRTLPGSFSVRFEGTAAAFSSSMSSMLLLVVLALVVIYIILGVLYEDFLHPITILSGLPSAALGGLLTLTAFGFQLDLYAMVGVIMLIGIVKKNAIMVVDFAIEAERKHGRTPAEAAVEGSLIRFRPILMTTMAAIMGSIPIAVGWGSGESRRPLGLVVVGGLILSQVVTLYLTPVFYTYMDDLKAFLQRKKHKTEASSEIARENA